ncbi:MAG TPA: hypothetical protein VM074_06235 [Solimonas sp.]|nr:hypothetical protein [Solimonas sp.]
MTSPLADTAWESCLLEPLKDPALESYALRHGGIPHPTVRYFARAPWVARMLVHWLPDHGLLVELELHLADLVGLVVSQENSCRFCYAAVRALLRIQGMSEERVQRLEQQLSRAEVEPALAVAVRFTRRMSRSDPRLVADDIGALRQAGFSEVAIRDLVFTIASNVLMNRTSTMPAVPPGEFERMPDLLAVRWLRPLLAGWMGRFRKPGQVTPPAASAVGPYAGLIDAYAGSPVAGLLRETLDEMWRADTLTRRCRALLFAVVARALNCAASQAELAALLAGEGVSEAQLDEVLAHLDAPWLDPVERPLVRFARETVWYEPQRLQQRTREMAGALSAAQLTDAIGTLALANALCRMQLAVAAAAPPA